MAQTSHPQQNHILDALPQAERERLFPYLKLGRSRYKKARKSGPKDDANRMCSPT
jgi:hypothetical protein